MIEIAFNSSFKRAFKKKIQGNTNLEARFWGRIAIFQKDPFDSRLRTHKLSGQLKDLWSFSIEYDARVIFSFVDDRRVLFVDIGAHKDVY